jgi:hypothetical protein
LWWLGVGQAPAANVVREAADVGPLRHNRFKPNFGSITTRDGERSYSHKTTRQQVKGDGHAPLRRFIQRFALQMNGREVGYDLRGVMDGLKPMFG